MNTENLVINESRETEVVEDLSAVSPNIDGAILSKALVIKAIDLCDLTTLVVTTDQSDAVWVSHLFICWVNINI